MGLFDWIAWMAGAIIVGVLVLLAALGERYVDSKMLIIRNRTQTVLKVTIALGVMAVLGMIVGAWIGQC